MKWSVLICLAAMQAAFASEASDAVRLGREARADRIPQGAIAELKRVAKFANGKEEIAVLVELARCLIDAGRADYAAEYLNKTIYRAEPEIIFWRAQARAQQGDYQGALADYTLAAAIDFPLREEASFGSARMLEALGRSRDALENIYLKVPAGSARHNAALLASAAILIEEADQDDLERAKKLLGAVDGGSRREQETRKYLEGRLALQSSNADAALRLYRELSPRDRGLAAGAIIGQADALSRQHHNEKAESTLEAFVRENPQSPLLGDVLAKLDEVRARQKDPSNATLKQWEKDDDHALLSATATYYLARSAERQDRIDPAIRNYREFIRQYPQHPLRTEAIIRLAHLLISTGQPKSAAEILAVAGKADNRTDKARLRFLRGETEYRSEAYGDAAKTFVTAANLEAGVSEAALANAAISAISAGNEPLAAEILNALRKQNAIAARQIELVEAFQSAHLNNPDAGEQLAWLVDRAGAVGEKARLALAEWRWQQGDGGRARLDFQRVANSKAAGGGDQKDYFAVYLADDGTAKSVDAVSSEAAEFIRLHPDSARATDVRMKWGEVLMRTGDYRGARVQFGEAAASATDPALKQSALFLEARAAVASMNPEELDAALLLLEQVASDKTSPLASEARLEQAMLQSALGKPEESVKILDSLSSATKDPRLRFTARLKTGYALLSMGAKDKAHIQEAIAVWRAVAADPEASPAERNEALTQAAAASEQTGDTDGALAAYYEVLTAPRDKQPEYFWYYRAGFEAAKLLSDKGKFPEAAAIYEKMAAAPGPRAEDAKEHVKRLRLENLIWED